MVGLQATWTPEDELFLWTPDGDLAGALKRDVPGAVLRPEQVRTRTLTATSRPTRREAVRGAQIPLAVALPLLATTSTRSRTSDSVQCLCAAAKLGLELAARQRVAPTIRGGEARWKAVLTRPEDRRRFDQLVAALPPVVHAIPTSERGRGAPLVPTPATVVHRVLDAVADSVFRTTAYPGAARGWARDLAESLRGEDPSFAPRDARFQTVPERLAAWSTADEGALRVAFALDLPADASKRDRFQLDVQVHPVGRPELALDVSEAWDAGDALEIDGQSYPHPALAALQGVARAARVHPPLLACLNGPRPHGLTWNADEVWHLLERGRRALRQAGFQVFLPPDFEQAGRRRIRARMRLEAPDVDAELDLGSDLAFHWEVVLGDLVLSGDEFSALLEQARPVVPFRGEWVLLDPEELEQLPDGLPQNGTLPAAIALRAALTGELDGVTVVVDEGLTAMLERLRAPAEIRPPAGLRAELRPYQLRGFGWLTTLGDLGLGACLADDMGLGKTIQLIAHLLHRRGRTVRTRPSLVVCPTSVLGNWQRELARFAPSLTVLRHHGQDRLGPEHFSGARVVLTTYGVLVRDAELLTGVDWDVAALDEAQNIKNPDARRARVARALKARHRVALTGTPLENRLDELWSLLQYLVPGFLGPRATFRREVAVPVERFGDVRVAERLKRAVGPFLMRRLKTDPDIVPDLPDKLERKAWCSLLPAQAALYQDVADTCLEEIAGAEEGERRGRVLAMLTALKQVCNHPVHYEFSGEEARHQELPGRSGKLERVTELLEAILDADEQVIVFTQYREMGDLLQRHILETFGLGVPFLHGATPPNRRDSMVEEFQRANTSTPILVVSLRAGGTGLNLTRATHVVHYDRWWNPAVEDQATDRAYRIGQRRDVTVHKLVVQGTLEERIDAMLEDKRALADSVVGAGEHNVTELDDDALRLLVTLGEDAVEEDE